MANPLFYVYSLSASDQGGDSGTTQSIEVNLPPGQHAVIAFAALSQCINQPEPPFNGGSAQAFIDSYKIGLAPWTPLPNQPNVWTQEGNDTLSIKFSLFTLMAQATASCLVIAY